MGVSLSLGPMLINAQNQEVVKTVSMDAAALVIITYSKILHVATLASMLSFFLLEEMIKLRA